MPRSATYPQVDANEILNYGGRAEFGLVDDGLMQTGVVEAPKYVQALENAVFLNLKKNEAKYRQKLADRDEAAKAFAEGAADLGQVLPEDRERLQKELSEIKNILYSNGGDIKSKPEVWIDFNDRLAKYHNGTIYAKSRFDTYTKGATEAAKETDPVKKKQMLDHLQQQRKKDMFQPFDPYQQSLDFDWSKVAQSMEQVKKQGAVDNATNSVKFTEKTDLPKAYQKYATLYKHGDKDEIGNNVDRFLESFYGQDGLLAPEAVINSVDQVNKRLAEIAVEEGYNPANPNSLPDYLKPVKAMVMNGQVQSAGYKHDDWFKIMLAAQYKNVTGSAYDENLGKAAKNKAEIGALNALNEQRRSAAVANRARARFTDAKTRGINAAVEENKPQQSYDELFKGKINSYKTVNGNIVASINARDMSKGLQDHLGIKPLKEDGTYLLTPTNIVLNGKQRSEDDFQTAYKYWRDHTRGTIADSSGELKYKKGDFIDFMNYMGDEGGMDVSYEIEVAGRNNQGKIVRTNRLNSWDNQRKTEKVSGLKGLLEEDQNTNDNNEE